MITIALYRGTSWVSKAIRWFTWSQYSHAALAVIDGSSVTVREAWHKGVRTTHSWDDGHESGTRIDLYVFRHPPTEKEEATILATFDAEMGKPYDWRGAASFFFRRRMQRDGAWFCSEIVAHSCMAGGRMLLACAPWRISPEGIANSPMLKPDGYVVA